jgi:large subunit ribosomal protein L28
VLGIPRLSPIIFKALDWNLSERTVAKRGRLSGLMSTLKKNKRIKLAKQLELYGDLKPTLGNQITRRGKAKYLGGNGRKTTGISRRAFKKNLQKVRVLEDGQIVRRRVPVSMLRSGLIVKPVVRAPFTIDEPVKNESVKK